MRLGPGATAADVKLHIDTAKTMKRYGGLMGRVRKLLSEIKEHVGLKGDFPTGSKAWEAKLEVEKLPRKIQKRLRELQNPHLDAKTKLEIESDIRNLEGQLAVHKQTLDSKVTTEGRGYVAADSEVDWSKASKEEKAKILEKHKMPTLEDLGLNPNEYKYVKTKSKDPPFSIWKVDNSGVPSLRLQKENGNWHLEKGKLSGEAEAKAILAGLSEEKAKAYQHLQNQLPESKLLFPLKKIAVTGVTFGELHGVNDSFFEQLTNVLAGAGKSRGEIEVLIDRLKTHKLMVIEGTGQLRRFDYRTFGGGVHGDGLEMHHAMPLWLGGTHEGGNLAGLNKEAHKEIHELFNSLQFDKNTALIPSILQKSSNLSFSEGAAIIDKDTGNIEFLQFNSSSELVSVTKKN
jgi:hypothetical protein